LQTRHARPGLRITNTLQTNGVLLDDRWCAFFRAQGFLVGLSLDGPAELHDRYRYDKKGRPTFDKALRGLKLLKSHGVEFNVLVVVNRHNGDHGRRVYTYLRDNGARFLQFIPIVERRGVGVHGEAGSAPPLRKGGQGGSLRAAFGSDVAIVHRSELTPRDPPFVRGGAETSTPHSALRTPHSPFDSFVSSRSVRPEQFGRFLIEVFEEWVKRDVGRVFVQIFDQALAAWMGQEPSLCIFRRECGRALAIEHNGDLFCCDHFVEPEHKLGNIHELPIVELASSEKQRQFGRDKQATLPEYCRRCEVRFACNGECPKNRFISTPDGEPGLNYLCGGYRRFFNHIAPVMEMMAEELRHGRPAANVMQRRRTERQRRDPVSPRNRVSGDIGRNDPC
ncbi:MAG: anaerobic sulfatase maturase, partial [Planctomycetaceae bacterium]